MAVGGARIDGILSAPWIGRVEGPAGDGDRPMLVVPDVPLDRVPERLHAKKRPASFAAGWLSMRGLRSIAAIGAIAAASFTVLPGAALAQSNDCSVPAAEARTMSRDEVTLREGLCRYVHDDFGGDWDAAWQHHAGGDDRVSRAELRHLLRDAEIGSRFSRGFWVDGVIDRFDGVGGPKNDQIDRSELDTAMR